MLYADPGSGLLLWQVLVAAVLGLLYQVRRVVYRIIFRKRE
jgi:predicted membrane protein